MIRPPPTLMVNPPPAPALHPRKPRRCARWWRACAPTLTRRCATPCCTRTRCSRPTKRCAAAEAAAAQRQQRRTGQQVGGWCLGRRDRCLHSRGPAFCSVLAAGRRAADGGSDLPTGSAVVLHVQRAAKRMAAAVQAARLQASCTARSTWSACLSSCLSWCLWHS